MSEQEPTPSIEELAAEVERLRAKNAELLQELKTTKGKANSSGAEVEALRLEVIEHKLTRPVAKALAGVLNNSKFAAQELGEHFTFALDDAGEVQMLDSDGKPVLITDGTTTRPISLESGELYKYFCDLGTLNHILRGSGASGGAAIGGGRGYTTKPTTSTAKPSSFGLR